MVQTNFEHGGQLVGAASGLWIALMTDGTRLGSYSPARFAEFLVRVSRTTAGIVEMESSGGSALAVACDCDAAVVAYRPKAAEGTVVIGLLALPALCVFLQDTYNEHKASRESALAAQIAASS